MVLEKSHRPYAGHKIIKPCRLFRTTQTPVGHATATCLLVGPSFVLTHINATLQSAAALRNPVCDQKIPPIRNPNSSIYLVMKKLSIRSRGSFAFPINRHSFPLPAALSGGACDSDDVEMIALKRMNNYTSLKDLMGDAAVQRPGESGWREIPIKEPLVQVAAWAYLRSSAAQARGEDRLWWRRVEEKLSGVFGCFNDVVSVMFKSWLTEQGIFWL